MNLRHRGQKKRPQLRLRFPLSRARPAPRVRSFRTRTFHTLLNFFFSGPHPTLFGKNKPSSEDAVMLSTLRDFFQAPLVPQNSPNLDTFLAGRRFVTAKRAEENRPRDRPGFSGCEELERPQRPRRWREAPGLAEGRWGLQWETAGGTQREAAEPLWPRAARPDSG